MRLFAAVYPPADVVARLDAAVAPLRAAAPALRWTPSAQMHATVRFYGEVEAAMTPSIAASIAEAARLFDPMPAELRGLGAFPTWGRGRVVWAGLAADPKLELLHHEIETRAMALGFVVEGRIFRPHLTLVRLGAEVAPPVRRAIREAARGVRVRDSFTLGSIALMQSTLGPGGAVHTLVADAPLGRS